VPQGDGSAVSPDLAAAQENDTVAKLYNEGLPISIVACKGAIRNSRWNGSILFKLGHQIDHHAGL
jgi:hypothetical protein